MTSRLVSILFVGGALILIATGEVSLLWGLAVLGFWALIRLALVGWEISEDLAEYERRDR